MSYNGIIFFSVSAEKEVQKSNQVFLDSSDNTKEPSVIDCELYSIPSSQQSYLNSNQQSNVLSSSQEGNGVSSQEAKEISSQQCHGSSSQEGNMQIQNQDNFQQQ